MIKIVALSAAVLALGAPCAALSQEPPCPNDGYIAAQMVPTKEVAEAIYRAVGRNLFPSNFKKFPIVFVDNKGDHWEVSQTNNDPPPKVRPNEVVVTTGGGQLYMDINKCTGAISHAALAR